MSDNLSGEERAALLKVIPVLARLAREPSEPEPEPEPPVPKPEEKAGPTFGLDISSHNVGLDLAQAYREGYRFVWIKVSEGPYRDGTYYINEHWLAQYAEAKRAGFEIGFYMFAVETGAKAQVDLFLREVLRGGVKLADHGVAVDFERYNEPYSYLTPSNETLEAIGKELRGNYPTGVYSSESFWEGKQEGTVPSGKWSRYEFDYAWIAHWPANVPLPHPQNYYREMADEYSPFKDTLGGKKASIGQICIGKVAGLNIDVNVFPGTLEEYRKLTTGNVEKPPEKPEPSEAQPKPETKPPAKPPPAAWDPVNGKLAPPGFVAQRPQPHSIRYDLRNPTRFIWREDVEEVVRNLYREFGKYKIFVNTYVNHPEEADPHRPDVSFDVWGGGGDRPGWRGLWLPEEIGDEVFDFLRHDPKPPDLRWYIWEEVIYGVWNGFAGEHFGDGSRFTAHRDHSHWTYDGPFVQIR